MENYWLCANCETANSLNSTHCEVCDLSREASERAWQEHFLEAREKAESFIEQLENGEFKKELKLRGLAEFYYRNYIDILDGNPFKTINLEEYKNFNEETREQFDAIFKNRFGFDFYRLTSIIVRSKNKQLEKFEADLETIAKEAEKEDKSLINRYLRYWRRSPLWRKILIGSSFMIFLVVPFLVVKGLFFRKKWL